MYFSRLTFNSQKNKNPILFRSLFKNNYREHQILWDLFSGDPSAKRDFLYRQVFEKGNLKYYVLSRRKAFDKSGIWKIEGPKTYNPALKKGQKLFFVLKANPTLSSPRGEKKRHDVVMHEKSLRGFKNLPLDKKPLLHELVRDSCIKWLKKKAAANGFSFNENEVAVDGYRQIQIYRRNKNICYSSVDFQGLLTVFEPEIFKEALEKGIGKSKAFGCGLMLIKKA